MAAQKFGCRRPRCKPNIMPPNRAPNPELPGPAPLVPHVPMHHSCVDAFVETSQAMQRVATPGPPEYPFVQGLFWLLAHKAALLEAVAEECKKYGRTWTLKWPFSPRYYFTADPAVVEHVLKTNFDNYVKGPVVYEKLEALLGNGIFNSDGERWRVQRKLATHLFSRREFNETIVTAFKQHGAELVAELSKFAASRTPVDIQSLFYRFTLDTIGDVAFGHCVGAMQNPDIPFAKSFDRAQRIVEKRFITPGWQVLELLNGDRRDLTTDVQIMKEYSDYIIQSRRDAADYNERRDLLSRFMAMKDEDTGEPLYVNDDAFLREVIMNFMIAGRDTTAQALSWSVYNVLLHPEVQQELCVEAQGLLGEAGFAAIGYEDIVRSLRYTQAVVQETLRLYPSVPKDVKQAIGDDTLPDGTFVKSGSVVAYLPHAMGRMPSNWAKAEEFSPRRFLEGEKHSQFRFIAFNAGYRTCLGQHMALAEAAFVLALIFRTFRLEMVPGQTVQYAPALTLPMHYIWDLQEIAVQLCARNQIEEKSIAACLRPDAVIIPIKGVRA